MVGGSGIDEGQRMCLENTEDSMFTMEEVVLQRKLRVEKQVNRWTDPTAIST